MPQQATEVRGDALSDADGPIPKFPPRAVDDCGRLIRLSPEERLARSEAAIRALRALNALDDEDPPGTDERFIKDLDEGRPHRPLFEGVVALLRNAGAPTAGPQDLDADAILAGQATTAAQPGDVTIIASTNVRHLARFPDIDARVWSAIT